ncbi:hypothetical protein pb186bvf_003958 [Paramecium bursaria]
MSDMEKVDLDALSKRQHPKQQNRPQPIQRRRPFRQENRQENNMKRTNNRKQQGGKLFQLDVFHLMADNNILHLIVSDTLQIFRMILEIIVVIQNKQRLSQTRLDKEKIQNTPSLFYRQRIIREFFQKVQ